LAVFVIFALGVVMTGVSLFQGYRRRRRRSTYDDQGFKAAIAALSVLRPGRLAVFPFTAVEDVALGTPHGVLWGAHGYGFSLLEPIYPVIKVPLSTMLCKYGCKWLLFDTKYWAEGEQVMAAEMPTASTQRYGTWRLLTLHSTDGRAATWS